MARNRKTEGDVVEFTDVFEDMPESKSLGKELLDETFIITNVVFAMGQYGEYALVTLSGEEIPYRTSSRVLISQLKATEEHIKQQGVRVTLSKQKTKKGREIMTFGRKPVSEE